MKSANSIFSGLGTTVFAVMSQFALDHKSVNLVQADPGNAVFAAGTTGVIVGRAI